MVTNVTLGPSLGTVPWEEFWDKEFRDRPRILAEVPDFKEEFLGLAPNSSGAKGLIERKNLLEAQIDDVRESGSDVAAALRAPQSQRSLPIGRS